MVDRVGVERFADGDLAALRVEPPGVPTQIGFDRLAYGEAALHRPLRPDQFLQRRNTGFDSAGSEVGPLGVVGPRAQVDVDVLHVERPRHEPVVVGHPDRDPDVLVQPGPRVHHGSELVGCADIEAGQIRELVELVAGRLRDAQRDQSLVAEPERDEAGVGLVDPPGDRIAGGAPRWS